MKSLVQFFHHLFNPHCEHCEEASYQSHICQSCEVLREEISRLRLENSRLLDAILNKDKDVESRAAIDTTNLRPIQSGAVPWKVRREMLEANDRRTAELIKKANEEQKLNQPKPIPNNSQKDRDQSMRVSDLEKELGVEDAIS